LSEVQEGGAYNVASEFFVVLGNDYDHGFSHPTELLAADDRLCPAIVI
jgi:hypothetical protein